MFVRKKGNISYQVWRNTVQKQTLLESCMIFFFFWQKTNSLTRSSWEKITRSDDQLGFFFPGFWSLLLDWWCVFCVSSECLSFSLSCSWLSDSSPQSVCLSVCQETRFIFGEVHTRPVELHSCLLQEKLLCNLSSALRLGFQIWFYFIFSVNRENWRVWIQNVMNPLWGTWGGTIFSSKKTLQHENHNFLFETLI